MNRKPLLKKTYNADAPDLLLKRISELSETLAGARAQPVKNQKAIDFYSDILATMKYAWAHMTEMRMIYKRIAVLEGENEFLKEWANDLQNRLNRFEVIEELKISGDFDKVVAAVDGYIQNANDLNQDNA